MKMTKRIAAMAVCGIMTATSMVGICASALDTTIGEIQIVYELAKSVSSEEELTVTTYGQEKTNWCWAACTEMLIKFYNPTSTADQSKIVKAAKGSVVDEAGGEDDVITAMKKYLKGYSYTTIRNQNMGFNSIKSSISKGNPVYLKMSTSIGNHAVVCSGYRVSSGINELYIHDPANGGSEYWGVIDENNNITCDNKTKGKALVGVYAH